MLFRSVDGAKCKIIWKSLILNWISRRKNGFDSKLKLKLVCFCKVVHLKSKLIPINRIRETVNEKPNWKQWECARTTSIRNNNIIGWCINFSICVFLSLFNSRVNIREQVRRVRTYELGTFRIISICFYHDWCEWKKKKFLYANKSVTVLESKRINSSNEEYIFIDRFYCILIYWIEWTKNGKRIGPSDGIRSAASIYAVRDSPLSIRQRRARLPIRWMRLVFLLSFNSFLFVSGTLMLDYQGMKFHEILIFVQCRDLIWVSFSSDLSNESLRQPLTRWLRSYSKCIYFDFVNIHIFSPRK